MEQNQKENLITTVRRDQAFILVECSDWKDALNNFRSQVQSSCDGVRGTSDYVAPQCREVRTRNDNYLAKSNMEFNRKCLKKIIECLQHLGAQGIA